MRQEKRHERVIILHGIGMHPLRMTWMEQGLRRAGFDTLNVKYPSLKMKIEECAEHTAETIAHNARNASLKTHFVTHSMGSLVALEILQQNRVPETSRAVLIAPPYRGSEVADFLAKNSLYRRVFGPAGQQLTTTYRNETDYKIPDYIEVGVIAGNRAYEYPLFLPVMKPAGEHDGLVSLKSTDIPGIKDRITIRMSHSFLIEKSVAQTVHFLTHGYFQHRPS